MTLCAWSSIACRIFGMAVPLVHRRIRRQAIEVALAVHVVHPDALGALDHHVERMIVVSSVLLLRAR